MRILYVEDNPHDADLARRLLARHAPDIELTIVTTQAQALEKLQQSATFDLVLADVHLPDGDGLAILTHIRGRGLPLAVVLITGAGDEEGAVAALRSGADDYVVKREGYLERLPRILSEAYHTFQQTAARRAHPIQVLYAEHNPSDRDLTRRHCQRFAPYIRLETVASAEQVLARLQERHFDVLLLDYRLPGMNAVEMLKLLKEKFDQELPPVVFVTGQGDEEIALQALKLGAMDYLPKRANYLNRLPTVLENAYHSDRLRREHQALLESEARYRTLFTSVPVGLYRSTPEGRLLDVNPALVATLGYPDRETLMKQDLSTLYLDPQDRVTFLEQVTSAGEVYRYATRLRRRDGTVIWASLDARAVIAEDGKLLYLDGSLQDITERVRAQEEREQLLAQIREQARQVQGILDTVPQGVLLLDAGGRILQANPVAEKDLFVLAGVHVGDVLTRLGDRPLNALLTSPPIKGLWHEVKADNRIFEVIARPVEYGQALEHWVLVINDATSEREIQAQLQQQERLAAVGQLAGGIAHDFNNIMAVIVLYAEMLARLEALSDQDRDKIATIRQQGWRAAQLIRQILDFSRQTVLERQPLDLLPLLKEQVKLLQRTLPEHIKIDLDYGEEACVVNADLARIQQIIMNLALNARDAMPEGGTLRIELRRIKVEPGKSPLLPEMAAGDWVRLTVSDTGTGIAPDVLPHIFEPFFTTKAPGKGSGLGLAQVHGIVGQHGGRIGVTTEVGKGTTFSIYLPASVAHPVAAPAPEISTLPQGRGEVVLIVEDNEAVRTALVKSLQQMNYQTLEATNGQKALAVMETHGAQIALILSDVVMPVMGGVALLHALRQAGWKTPVILLTGHEARHDLKALYAQGLSAWLYKPPSLEQLAQTIAEVLSK